jgi:hypothetical protein
MKIRSNSLLLHSFRLTSDQSYTKILFYNNTYIFFILRNTSGKIANIGGSPSRLVSENMGMGGNCFSGDIHCLLSLVACYRMIGSKQIHTSLK